MELGMLGITSILVEGGKTVISSFINQKLFDRLTVYIAPRLLGNGNNIFENKEIKKISQAIEFEDVRFKTLKDQVVFEGYPKERPCLPV
jgi:diaminohydroxyphosphoribosylaminopyrimidine deaminase/5-amino-6-(5-phosphoribosylamino)uracil reductase